MLLTYFQQWINAFKIYAVATGRRERLYGIQRAINFAVLPWIGHAKKI